MCVCLLILLLFVAGPCLVLRATRPLEAGEEVLKNYDTEADYSDLFERYGFLDGTSSLHTAEVSMTRGGRVVVRIGGLCTGRYYAVCPSC